MKLFNLRSLCLFAFVFCMMLVLGTDAFAFGKRGGFFSRGQSCTTCSGGSCASGSCATGCENGQCAPTSQFIQPNQGGLTQSAPQVFMGTNGKQYQQVCENGKCIFVEVIAQTEAATLGSSPVTLPLKAPVETITLHKEGQVWKDTSGQVWKK